MVILIAFHVSNYLTPSSMTSGGGGGGGRSGSGTGALFLGFSTTAGGGGGGNLLVSTSTIFLVWIVMSTSGFFVSKAGMFCLISCRGFVSIGPSMGVSCNDSFGWDSDFGFTGFNLTWSGDSNFYKQSIWSHTKCKHMHDFNTQCKYINMKTFIGKEFVSIRVS